jgi:hypothetical protein
MRCCPGSTRNIVKAISGWLSSIGASHGTLTLPRLHDVVAIAKALLPFGKVPTWPKEESESNKPNETSVPGITLDWAEAAPARSAAPIRPKERCRGFTAIQGWGGKRAAWAAFGVVAARGGCVRGREVR